MTNTHYILIESLENTYHAGGVVMLPILLAGVVGFYYLFSSWFRIGSDFFRTDIHKVIKRMRVEVTRADGYVDTWETNPEEWSLDNTYTLYESGTPRFGEIMLLPVTNLYRQVYGRETGVDEEGIYQYDKVPFTSEYVSRIRLTVLEADPGTKYKDLCLSGLIVLDGYRILE